MQAKDASILPIERTKEARGQKGGEIGLFLLKPSKSI